MQALLATSSMPVDPIAVASSAPPVVAVESLIDVSTPVVDAPILAAAPVPIDDSAPPPVEVVKDSVAVTVVVTVGASSFDATSADHSTALQDVEAVIEELAEILLAEQDGGHDFGSDALEAEDKQRVDQGSQQTLSSSHLSSPPAESGPSQLSSAAVPPSLPTASTSSSTQNTDAERRAARLAMAKKWALEEAGRRIRAAGSSSSMGSGATAWKRVIDEATAMKRAKECDAARQVILGIAFVV